MTPRKRLTKKERQHVYDKYNGHCAYCGCELTIKEMQVDHIEPMYWEMYYGDKNLDRMSNYNPSCRMCNFYKGTNTLEQFRTLIETIIERLGRQMFIFKVAQKYGLIEVKQHPVKFYFEKNENKSVLK